MKIIALIKNICTKAMRPSEKSATKLCVCLLFGLGRISNCRLPPSLAEELSFRWCCLSFMWSSSDLKTQAAQLIWAASLPYCTGCCTGTTCQNICALSKYLRAPIFSPFPGEKSKIYHCTENSYMITKAVQIQLQHFWPLNRGRPRFWPRSPEMVNFQQWGVRGWGRGGGNGCSWPPLSHLWEAWGGGRGRAGRSENKFVLVLNAACMHVVLHYVSLSHISVLPPPPIRAPHSGGPF